ncbi:MAG: TonB-dependent receptor [Chitinophagaceae bacterium]
MTKKIVLPLCAVVLLQCFSLVLFSQSLQVTGRVTNKTNHEPLQGATVSVKGAKTNTTTAADGSFTITAPKSGSIIVISYAGMATMERAVTSAGVVNFELENGDPKLDEVVVVGYGTQKKTSLTASVSTVKGADIVRQPVSDLGNALGGRATGVLFTQGSGQAGNDAANIMIRGIGTNGNASPLFIVDGVPRNYSQLNPSDVESITVLKDAAAVAPYGMGGANGVILVTTKRGKLGRPTLSYDGYVGIQNPTVITHFVNSYQYATMKNVGAANAGATVMPYSAADLQKYKDGSDPDGHPNIDPINDMILKNTLQTSHSLNLTGGTETIKYAMGLGYFDQQGMFPGIKYKRYNLSANLQAQVTKGTSVGLVLNGRVENRNLSGAGYNTQTLFENLINTTSISTPLIYSNGKHPYIYASFYDNPSYRNITGNTMLTQFFIEQQLPVKGLSVKFVGSYDWNPFDPYNTTNAGIASLTRSWSSPFSYYNVDTTTHPYTYPLIPAATLPSFSEEYHQTQAFTYQGYINYNRSFGKSAVTGLVVLESRNSKSLAFNASRNNYNLPITELFAGGSGASDLGNGGSSQAVKQRSLVYRVTYGFDNKYLLEAAGRYDGHYYFAPGHRFGFFPAFSAAWRISKESFMSNINWINELKIRASYGESGNLAGAPFQYQSGFILYGNSSILNGVQGQGLYENTEPNPNITWEKAKKTDIGFETRMFNGLLNIEADYFHENRNNMLVYPNVTVPAEYGIGLSQVNAGSMQNHGIEVAISSNYAVNKDLNISFSGNFSYAKNKLIQVFENPATYDNPNLRQTGRPLGTPFGYKAIGYFTSNDFASPGVLKPGIATQTFSPLAPGEIRYADISGPNGKPDGLIDYNDQIAMGNPTYPAIVYGFSPAVNYKGFELSLLFQGAGQRDIQIANSAAWAFDNNKNASVTTLDYWTPDNPNASYPRMTTTPTANTSQTSTFWQRSVSYLRLRTGTLGYTFPKRISERLKMSVLSVYVSGQNIITWTPIKNFDPEVSNARGWYFPTQKALTVGLRVQF